MTPYSAIAFDLDDTLLDTSQLLVPVAARRACQALISQGATCTLQECLDWRHEQAALLSHTDIFSELAKRYQAPSRESATAAALQEFYNPPVPSSLPLMPGALANLEQLKTRYNLYLVTVGSRPTQVQKIKALNIESYFKKVFILDSFAGEKKETAFREILRTETVPPAQLLSVGNRLSSEIRDGKRVGATTCYFAYGEHVGEKAVYPEDHPDFTIYHHEELIRQCGL